MYITKIDVFVNMLDNKDDDKCFVIIIKVKKIYVDNISFNNIVFIKIKKI